MKKVTFVPIPVLKSSFQHPYGICITLHSAIFSLFYPFYLRAVFSFPTCNNISGYISSSNFSGTSVVIYSFVCLIVCFQSGVFRFSFLPLLFFVSITKRLCRTNVFYLRFNHCFR